MYESSVAVGALLITKTVKVTSSKVAAQLPSAAIVYLIVVDVSVLMLAGVYVEPAIDPPPDKIEKVPPLGFPIKVFVSPSVILAVLVVLSAVAGQTGVTVKVTSSKGAAQLPSAGIEYLIVTFVSVLISAGVYVFPVIDPPPEIILHVPLAQLVGPSCVVPLFVKVEIKPDVLVFQ